MTLSGQQRYDERRLFRACRSGEPHARERLVERFLPLAHSLARRYTRRAESLEDLEQVACLALIKAIDGFDTERGTAFSSYAVPTIAGAIKRYYRDSGWWVRPPREMQDLAVNVARANDTLSAATGSPATPAEIAAFLGVSVEAVVEAREAYGAMNCESLDEPHRSADDDRGGSLLDTLALPDRELDGVCDRMALEALLDTLPDRERLVIELYYQHELTQLEIGERLGYSQMHISRILRTAVKELTRLAAAQERTRAGKALA
jgi:RNA polymerase sigma-B factor